MSPKAYNLLFCVIFIALIPSCKQSNTKALQKPNSAIKKESSDKVIDLTKYDKLIDFFQSAMCEAEPEEQAFYTCMQAYFRQTKTNKEKEVLKQALAEQDFILSKIDRKLLSEIWNFTNDTNQYTLNKKGEYYSILSKAAKAKPLLELYKKTVDNTGQLPLDFTKYFEKLNKEDFNNKSIQIIIAVHYFSLNQIT